ncbi:hypothetical protein CBS101457_001756 [Exobasidium rhododendri]|nr:hypothetical protein CBS101457_001756 [Exobasidium rhododendri]
MASSSSGSLTMDAGSRTKQQSSSRMMKNSRRGRPFAKDIHDLFATLIASLQLTTHRQMFKSYHNSFTTDEAAENLSALKFSQSNRAPDPREPSRVVTTTTTTTFSMSRDMAKGICQHFMDARLIENAADYTNATFKDRGIYVITPKGLHILERFITKNGINAEHLVKVFTSQPICMKLLHLERRTQDDELLINRPVIEVIFRRFVGRQPNYPPIAVDGQRDTEFDRTLGVEVQDITEKLKSGRGGVKVIKHTFPAISILDWLCDFTTICARDEASEIAAHFVRLNLIELLVDRSRRENEEVVHVHVEGDDGRGNISRSEFRMHYKAIYGVTDWGRTVARWPGYNSVESPHRESIGGYDQILGGVATSSPRTGPNGEDTRSINSHQGTQSSLAADFNGMARTGSDYKSPSSTSIQEESRLHRKPSDAERLRNDYIQGRYNSNSEESHAQQYNLKDSNTNRLKQILEEPALRSLFRDFLKQNFCEENLSFWLDVQDFKRRFHTTSSAVAVRPSTEGNGGSHHPLSGKGGGMVGAVRKLGGGSSKAATAAATTAHSSLTAMERHQQDLIAMAFVIYSSYLAPASDCELNIEHNLRSELVGYMNKILSEAKGPNGEGLSQINTKDYDLGPSLANKNGEPASSTLEEKILAVNTSMPRAPMHASQLQTMVRLYERIQDHIFRLMATDSVPRFIKEPRFLSFIKSVQEYAEALESGQIDPNINAGPGLNKSVVDAMDLGGALSTGPSSGS